MRPYLSRRRFLENAALAALLAPVLRRRDAHAAPASPRRLILVFSPNGPMSACGPASGSERDFQLHPWWKPLERHTRRGIFLSHMAATGSGTVTGDGHGLGGQMFSGFGASYGTDQYANKGPTIDQVIGKRLEAEYRAGLVRSVVWGLASTRRGGGTGDAFCAAPGRNIAPEIDPSRAWHQLFARFVSRDAGPEGVARAAALVARERSVLDFVGRDCAALGGALGREGARLLDEHCTTVRTMERNLVTALGGTPAGRRCAPPEDFGARDWPDPENAEEQMGAFVELAAATLACELTHVIAFQFGAQAARNRLPAAFGVASAPKADSGDSGPAHHPWTHQRDSEERTAALRTFTTFYAESVARLVDRLETTPDGQGRPLIDSTVVLWVSELGGNEKNRDYHQTGSLPVVWLGNGQGTFATGRYLRGKSGDGGNGGVEPGRDMARLLVAAVRYMGLNDVRTVGATGVDGPLASLFA